jgi:HSP20 family molecular chaperone IbpA
VRVAFTCGAAAGRAGAIIDGPLETNMRYRRITYRFTEVSPRRAVDPLTPPLGSPNPLSRPYWTPPTDVAETESAYFVRCEIAGLRESDVQLTVYMDALVVQGSRICVGCDQARFHAAQVRFGPFRVEVRLPADVDLELVDARYDSGFIEVVLPKRAGAAS